MTSGHHQYAEKDNDDADEFTCDLCRNDRFGGVIKQLELKF